jgi:hypothetical protein
MRTEKVHTAPGMNFDSVFCVVFIALAYKCMFHSSKDASVGLLLMVVACSAACAQVISSNGVTVDELNAMAYKMFARAPLQPQACSDVFAWARQLLPLGWL